VAGGATMAQLCRRHELCPSVIRNWREHYARGELADPEGICQSQEQRIWELERLAGQLALENALPGRAVSFTLRRRSEASSPITGPGSDRLRGDVS